MMGEFLYGEALSTKIREVMQGNDPCCAVAFWGDCAVQELFGNEETGFEPLKVVCDLSMGGTNPETLRRLGAPNNANLRHLPRLHSKLYLSVAGVVVASANASNNGIGFMGANAALIEAGVFFEADTKEWFQTVFWFQEEIWRDAKPVDAEALETARSHWLSRQRAGKRANPSLGRPPSFLEVLRDDPWLFGDVAFVFSTAPVPREQLRNARDEADEQGIPEEVTRGADVYGAFGADGIDQWPLRFINLHRPNDRIGVHFRMRGAMVAGTHFARRSGITQFTDLSPHMTGQIDLDALAQCKTEMEEIFDDKEPRIWSAVELSERLFGRRDT